MKDDLTQFDSIRPFAPDELPQAYDRLLGNAQFRAVIAYLYPQTPLEAVAQKMRACTTNLEFQRVFCYGFLEKLLHSAATGCSFDAAAIDVTRRYTFISNHRDIVLDSALLNKLLIDKGFTTTCEIAIGDNLLSLEWVRDLVRINKSFIVERSLPPRELLTASVRLSRYMHYAIAEKHENVWIAQREGRAKNGDDRTQESLLKMLTLSGEGTPAQRLMQLHPVPLSISYEYDPCDYLKAGEAQLKRDNPAWRKSAEDDIRSMRTGIMGYKGNIHYEAAPCMDEWLTALPDDLPKADFYRAAARHIDREIHLRYRIYPINRVALNLAEGRTVVPVTDDEHRAAVEYLQSRVRMTDLPQRDEPFLMQHLIEQYANPLRNHRAAQAR